MLCAPPHLQSRSSRESESMGAQENGLTLEGLAHKLEAMQRENAERMEALERENERMRSKNTELRDEVAALRDSGTSRDGLSETSRLVPQRDQERDSGLEERVSRRALLTKAGAAAVAAMAAGTILRPREAKAHTTPGGNIDAHIINAHFVSAEPHDSGLAISAKANTPSTFPLPAIFGENLGEGPGVTGTNLNAGPGVRGIGAPTGVEGTGDDGVAGTSRKNGFSGVYGRHNNTTDGPGVTGDGKGDWPGVWGRNNTGDGVTGETGGAAKSGVYGRHLGASGFGVTGDGKGATAAGVLGRNAAGYGGQFQGGRAQLKLVPAGTVGRPTTGAHARGELYLDSRANLYVCTVSGAPGTWRRVQTVVA